MLPKTSDPVKLLRIKTQEDDYVDQWLNNKLKISEICLNWYMGMFFISAQEHILCSNSDGQRQLLPMNFTVFNTTSVSGEKMNEVLFVLSVVGA